MMFTAPSMAADAPMSPLLPMSTETADSSEPDLVAMAATHFTFDPSTQESAASPSPATAPADIKPAAKAFGDVGSTRWNIIGSVASNFKDAVTPQVSLSLSYFIMPNVSLDPQINVLYAGQDGEDAFGAGFGLLFRWHFVHHETWSIYVEGGAGLLFATHDVPAGTSNIDFTPQVVLGGSFDLGCDTRLMTGVGWYHISNANTGINNDGRDQVIGYVGLSFPF
jgi:hypothetical protein